MRHSLWVLLWSRASDAALSHYQSGATLTSPVFDSDCSRANSPLCPTQKLRLFPTCLPEDSSLESKWLATRWLMWMADNFSCQKSLFESNSLVKGISHRGSVNSRRISSPTVPYNKSDSPGLSLPAPRSFLRHRVLRPYGPHGF